MERFGGNPESSGCLPELVKALVTEINESVGVTITNIVANLADTAQTGPANWVATRLHELGERLKRE